MFDWQFERHLGFEGYLIYFIYYLYILLDVLAAVTSPSDMRTVAQPLVNHSDPVQRYSVKSEVLMTLNRLLPILLIFAKVKIFVLLAV